MFALLYERLNAFAVINLVQEDPWILKPVSDRSVSLHLLDRVKAVHQIVLSIVSVSIWILIPGTTRKAAYSSKLPGTHIALAEYGSTG